MSELSETPSQAELIQQFKADGLIINETPPQFSLENTFYSDFIEMRDDIFKQLAEAGISPDTHDNPVFKLINSVIAFFEVSRDFMNSHIIQHPDDWTYMQFRQYRGQFDDMPEHKSFLTMNRLRSNFVSLIKQVFQNLNKRLPGITEFIDDTLARHIIVHFDQITQRIQALIPTDYHMMPIEYKLQIVAALEMHIHAAIALFTASDTTD